MVGGIVIGLTRKGGETHVHVADCPHYPKHGRGDECPRPDTCCVYTDEIKVSDGTPVVIEIGDSFWWQSGKCYWSPRANAGKTCNHQHHYSCNRPNVDYDIALKKIGYSH